MVNFMTMKQKDPGLTLGFPLQIALPDLSEPELPHKQSGDDNTDLLGN